MIVTMNYPSHYSDASSRTLERFRVHIPSRIPTRPSGSPKRGLDPVWLAPAIMARSRTYMHALYETGAIHNPLQPFRCRRQLVLTKVLRACIEGWVAEPYGVKM